MILEFFKKLLIYAKMDGTIGFQEEQQIFCLKL
jgi:hypothetical protein